MSKRDKLYIRDRYHKAKAHLLYPIEICNKIRKATSVSEATRAMEAGREAL